MSSPQAGLWVRSIALLVDLLIMLPFFVVGRAVQYDSLWLVPLCAYFALGWWRSGHTVGKWLFRLQVRSVDKKPLTLGQCVLRAFLLTFGIWAVKVLSLLLRLAGYSFLEHPAASFIGFVFLAAYALGLVFRSDRRGVHDLIAGTSVHYKLGVNGRPSSGNS